MRRRCRSLCQLQALQRKIQQDQLTPHNCAYIGIKIINSFFPESPLFFPIPAVNSWFSGQSIPCCIGAMPQHGYELKGNACLNQPNRLDCGPVASESIRLLNSGQLLECFTTSQRKQSRCRIRPSYRHTQPGSARNRENTVHRDGCCPRSGGSRSAQRPSFFP